jgi:hypothetical protein
MRRGREVYRTGTFLTTARAALVRCEKMVQQMAKESADA